MYKLIIIGGSRIIEDEHGSFQSYSSGGNSISN